MKDNLRIPYGVAKFKTVRDEGLYYVDKTAYIRALEQSGRFLFFVRPRRFGKSDYAKLKVIADLQRRIDPENAEDVMPVTERIAADGEISFPLKESFPADEIPAPDNFKSLFYYYGVLTMKERREGADWFGVPNACVRRQVFDYLRANFARTHAPDWTEWRALASAFAYRGEWRPFLERLAEDYAGTTPVRGGIQGEHRIQGYMQAEFGHLDFYNLAPEMELSRGFCDFCLFPERYQYGDVRHSYLIELKYSRADAADSELAAKREDALEQLAKYRADPFVPRLRAARPFTRSCFCSGALSWRSSSTSPRRRCDTSL